MDGVHYRKVAGLDQSEVNDGFIIYDAARDRVHFLNATGAIVLELCDGTRTAADMARFLTTSFDLPEAPAASVQECLATLLAEGLIEPCAQS